MTKNKASTKSVAIPSPRRFGEVTLAPLTIADHKFDSTSNLRQFSYSVDLHEVPPPAFKFVCDAVNVRLSDGDCRFMFMQRDIVSADLARALLVVHMSPHMAGLFSRSIALDRSSDSITFEPFELTQEPKEVRAVEATYVKAQGTNDSGAIDFFYASPFDLSSMHLNTTSLAVEPVVRVQMRPRVYHSFLKFVKNNLDLEGGDGSF